ncbi:membrane protein [Sinomonas atrocyanea]|nr:membrane protein [Sinomonas atrocyanea]GGG57204.1 membrane protein [Sinomonas atrocyanea]
MTWSHPRGLAPMRALAEQAALPGPLSVPGSRVRWDAQDLAGFESRPIDALAACYDLVVLDHPGLGRARAARALAPLEELFPAAELAAWEAASVGAAYESYRYEGHQWALPVDAAAQVSAHRPDLLADVPATWEEVLALPAEVKMCVPTAGPHTLLTFLGIAAAVDPALEATATQLVPQAVGREALDLLGRLIRRTPPDLLDLDPIEILDRMQTGGIAYSPLVFGYVTYSDATAGGLPPVCFRDAPAHRPGGTPGSVLGGTGLALAARSADDERLLEHVRQAMHGQAQRTVIPAAGGQPSATAAWEDPAVNARWLDFYAATRRTQDAAWRRPRFDGWIAVQSGGSRLIYEGLRRKRDPKDLLDELDVCYRWHRPTGASN